MRLIDHYRQDLLTTDGRKVPTKEAKATRIRWHAAAKRYLAMLSITSDPVPDYPDTDHVRPRAAFFLSRPIDELIELYKATAPANRPKP